MSSTEGTPVTIHQHTGSSTTFDGPANPNEIKTLAPDQEGDAVLGTAVLTDGTEVVVSATVTQVPYSFNYANSPGYASVQVTSIDNGTPTTNTLSLGSPDDTSGGVNPNLAGRGTSAETGTQAASDFLDRVNYAEDMQIVALSGGGYVIAETTVDDNLGPVNGGLYFEVFNASGQIVTPWTLVNTVDPPSGNINGGSQFYTNPNNHADASENDYFQLQATSGGGFAIQWAENDEANGYFERFNSTGTATDTPVNYWNNVSGTLGDGFAVDTNGNIAIAIPTSEDVYTPSTFAIYNSNDTQILRETWQAADGTMLPVISNPGHSGVLPINSEGSPQFQALPGGEFLAVVTDPTGPWNVQNGYPGVDIYLQRISVSGSTVTFDTPVLIGENLNSTPVVMKSGNILLNISTTATPDYVILAASELPSTTGGVASSTPATLTPLSSLLPSGVSIVSAVADNTGGFFAALQSGVNTGYYYGRWMPRSTPLISRLAIARAH